MPENVVEKIDALDKLIWSKQTWIDDHGSRRPIHEVETQRANLQTLQDIRDDYARSLEKARAAE